MNTDNFYSEIELELKQQFETGPLAKDPAISLEESLSLLSFYQKLNSLLKPVEELEGSLLRIFEKEFGKVSPLLKKEEVLSRCIEGLYLFPDTETFSFDPEKTRDESLIGQYLDKIELWQKKTIELHEKSQQKILNNLDLNTKQSELECSCQKCIADYRAKLRDVVYQDVKSLIENFVNEIDGQVLEAQLSQMSKSYEKLKNLIHKKIGKVKNKLRRGSVNRLNSDIKYLLKQNLGPTSDIGKSYNLRVQSYFVSLLNEMELDPNIISEEEYEKFYSQQGLNLWRSKGFLKVEFEKFVRAILSFKRKDISATILRDYLGQFWLHSPARKIKRKIIYHMGPTNSGKTYHAIEAVAKAQRGCYLAPLRLLASELFDTLNDKGVPTTLLTGEEVVEIDGAKHFSSTIEMARLNDEFDCVVIDEIQMITDSQRGWAWTRALVNMNAPEIHLCGDPSVFELVKQILKLTGDELEVKNYERMTKLTLQKSQVRLVDLERNDTLIVFSRKNALKYKRDLENLGYKVSVVYGRLSPEVRREQARKFDSGETDIMVATDAIAMGMNLPVKRIVFSAVAKFFNSQEYPLTASELKQIAGRAGRYQRFPEGHVTTLKKVDNGLDIIAEALHAELEQKELAMVGPDLDIFRSVNKALEENGLSTLRLSEFLRLFNTMTFEKPFFCVDLTEMIEVTEMVENIDRMEVLSDAEIFGFACAPVNLGLIDHVEYFMSIANKYVGRQTIQNSEIDESSELIDYLETSIKCVELYQWLARHFDNNYFVFDEVKLLHNKGQAIDKLNDLLSEKIAKHCPSCGVKLPETFEFNICEVCFSQRRQNRFRKPRGFDKKKKNKEGNSTSNRRKKSSSSRPRRRK